MTRQDPPEHLGHRGAVALLCGHQHQRGVKLLQFGDVSVYVIHDLGQLDIEPRAAGVGVVISGHSHQPLVRERNGVLYVNPGSAGPRRFKLPIAVAELDITGKSVTARIVELSDKNRARHRCTSS